MHKYFSEGISIFYFNFFLLFQNHTCIKVLCLQTSGGREGLYLLTKPLKEGNSNLVRTGEGGKGKSEKKGKQARKEENKNKIKIACGSHLKFAKRKNIQQEGEEKIL